MSHTSGPWSVKVNERWPFTIQILDSEGNVIISRDLPAHSGKDRTIQDALDCVHFSRDERERYSEANYCAVANCHLAAAAPDLLNALENLLAVMNGEGGTRADCKEIARAAIAKAKGETP